MPGTGARAVDDALRLPHLSPLARRAVLAFARAARTREADDTA